MKSTNRKPLEFTPNPNNPKLSQRENRQKNFLHFLAEDESINDACALVGVTRYALEKWRDCGKDLRAIVLPLHENPDKPYKTPQTQAAANLIQNQQDSP